MAEPIDQKWMALARHELGHLMFSASGGHVIRHSLNDFEAVAEPQTDPDLWACGMLGGTVVELAGKLTHGQLVEIVMAEGVDGLARRSFWGEADHEILARFDKRSVLVLTKTILRVLDIWFPEQPAMEEFARQLRDCKIGGVVLAPPLPDSTRH